MSPDGTMLAYIQEASGRCRASAPCPPSDLVSRLIVRDVASGVERQVRAPVSTGVSRLSWSGDDVHLAVSDGNGFWVVDTSTKATARHPLALFPPADSITYWSDATYRGSSGAIAAVSFCPETVGCDQQTEVLSIDPATSQATVLARLNFGTSSLSFDSSGDTFAYIGLPPGTALPTPLHVTSCAAAVVCLGTPTSRRLTPVDFLLIWRHGTPAVLGRGYLSVALSGRPPPG